jgi:hypothetical protein
MAKGKSTVHPYSPSWIDRFFDWVERLPIPKYLFFLLLYVIAVVGHHAILWSQGLLPTGEFSQSLLFSVYMWGFLQVAAYSYLRNAANDAITKFKLALNLSAPEFEKVKSSFVNLSPRGALIGAAIAILAIFLIGFGGYFQILSPLFSASAVTLLFSAINLAFITPFAVGFFYYVIRSLILVPKIFDRVTRINLFNLNPLYVLARFTSRAGMIFLVYLLLNFLTAGNWGSEEAGEAITVFYLFFNSGFAILAFVLPLLGIHRRLEAAKESAVEANNDLIELGFAKMQALVKAGKHEAVPRLRASNSALLEYRQELAKISTWPWDGATLRTFITALAVPMIVWAVQQVLQRTLVK